MWGMRYFLLIIAVVVMGQSVLAADKKPLIADPIVEKKIRKSLKKPEGELTKADLEKVMRLDLFNTQVNDAGVAELLKALLKCTSTTPRSNPMPPSTLYAVLLALV